MKKLSSVHHYIPKFFTKGFTDEEGYVYIYDKKINQIHHKRRSPKSIFFELYRNTGIVNGKPFDELETTYFKFLDDFCNRVLCQLRTHHNPFDLLDAEKIVQLKWFINNLFWRLPKNDEMYEQMYPEALLALNQQKNENPDLINSFPDEFKQTDFVKKLVRIQATFNSFDIENISQIPIVVNLAKYSGNVFLLGDYPMVFKKEPGLTTDIHKDVIFPLSGDLLFTIVDHNKSELYNTELIKLFNLQIIHQAHRYVVGDDPETLSYFVELYSLHMQMNLPLSAEVVFNQLYSSND